MGELTIAPADLQAALVMCKHLAGADHEIVPHSYRGKPGAILAAIQHGAELGLKPMQSLRHIAIIKGKATIYGDMMMALVRSHPECLDIEETIEGKGTDKAVARCVVHRKGCKPSVTTFSVEDAIRADLWGNKGPWTSYPYRMLQMRARGFALRDNFADALAGFITTEEAQDYPDKQPAKPRKTAKAEPTVITADAVEVKAAELPAKPNVSDDTLRALAHFESIGIDEGKVIAHLEVNSIEEIKPEHLDSLRAYARSMKE